MHDGFLASKQKVQYLVKKGMFSVWRLQNCFAKKKISTTFSWLLNVYKSYFMQNVHKTIPYMTFSVLAILLLKSTISTGK